MSSDRPSLASPADDASEEPPAEPSAPAEPSEPAGDGSGPGGVEVGQSRRERVLTLVAGLVAALVLLGAIGLVVGNPFEATAPAPTDSEPAEGRGSGGDRPTGEAGDLAAARSAAVERILETRTRAVLRRDRAAWMSVLDPTQAQWVAEQGRVFDRLGVVPFAEWTYVVVGDGPALAPERAAALPEGSAIVRVRLTYRIEDTGNRTDREQWLTVAPRGGRWLLAGDTDAEHAGFHTQRDLWQLGPVQLVRGEHSTVLADQRGSTTRELQRLAQEADRAVIAVGEVWTQEWSRRPVLVLPRTQKDMATLIGESGSGLSQIAAVTTGAFESGQARGDRVIINPAAFTTLGEVGRSVVLAHELTHVATRASTVVSPPIWLSEGFADYVAYEATHVPTAIVAADVIDEVRDGRLPRRLPEQEDFDAGEGDIAAAYEGAWLACRMIAREQGEEALVQLYIALSDSAGSGWPDELEPTLGVTVEELTRDWRAYLRRVAA